MVHQNERGFTLTELIVVMAIFMFVIIISTTAFETIAEKSSQQSKSAETQIAGIVGLEILRADLEQAGFGLPWDYSPAISFSEAREDGDNDFTALIRPSGTTPATYNDSPGSAPRPVLSDNTTFNLDSGGIGSNYLVIKSIVAAGNATCKKWTTISYDKDGNRTRRIWGNTDRDLTDSERVILVKNSMNTTPPSRQLSANSSTVFAGTFATYSSPASHQSGETFEMYGISPDTDVRFPFNRADYYVARPTAGMPGICAPNTGILYKSAVLQGTGSNAGKLATGMPLLDCVADMQVVYGLDSDQGGRVNQYLNAPANTATPTAADIRSQLREIRVYILAQEGKKDRFYSYPSNTIQVGEVLGGLQRGRSFNLNDRIGPDYKNYRWKVYTIVVRPKNLIQ